MIVEALLGHLVAEAAPSFDGGLADWLKLAGGVGGGTGMAALAWALYTDRLIGSKRYQALVKERDDARAEVQQLNLLMRDEMVPLFTRNVDVLKAIDGKLAPSAINLRPGAG